MQKKDETRLIRKLFRVLLPAQAFAMGLPAVNTLLDSFIIGNYLGQSALASIGFVSPLMLCLSAISGVLSTGTQMLCGRSLGKGDRDGLCSIFNTMLLLCVLFGLALSAVCLLLPESVSLLLGASGEVNAPTANYLRGLGLGMVFALLSGCLLSLIQMECMKRVTTVTMFILLAVNVGGNLLNVLVLHWGLFGAGFFMSMSNLAAVLVLLPSLLIKSRVFRFSPKSIRVSVAAAILRTGSPNAVHSLDGMLRVRFVNQFVYSLGGTLGMAAMAVADTVNIATGEVLNAGFFGAGSTIASVLVGHRDSSSLRDFSKVMTQLGWGLYAICYALIFVLAEPLSILLGAPPESVSAYVTVLRLYNLWMLTDCLASPVLCIYQAMGEIRRINLFSFFVDLLIPVCIVAALVNRLGLNLVYCTALIGSVAAIPVLIIDFRLRAKRWPRSVYELAYIPSTISAPRENRFKAAITTVEEATEASRQLTAFCRNKGMAPRTAYYCGLCLEEIAVDTVKNRFTKHTSAIDLRVICENGTIRMMFRDDCPYFDPNEWLMLCKPEDESRSIGIRMVCALSREMNYVSTLGLNVLTITLEEKQQDF